MEQQEQSIDSLMDDMEMDPTTTNNNVASAEVNEGSGGARSSTATTTRREQCRAAAEERVNSQQREEEEEEELNEEAASASAATAASATIAAFSRANIKTSHFIRHDTIARTEAGLSPKLATTVGLPLPALATTVQSPPPPARSSATSCGDADDDGLPLRNSVGAFPIGGSESGSDQGRDSQLDVSEEGGESGREDIESGQVLQLVDPQLIEATLVPPATESQDDTTAAATPREPIVEAKPLVYSKLKRFLLILLILVAVAATVVAIAISLKHDDEKKSNTAGGTTNTNNDIPVIPPMQTTVSAADPSSSSSSSSSSVSNLTTDEAAPSAPKVPTLERVRHEGILRCGVHVEAISDIYSLVPGKENTFTADLCRAIAAAAMGKDNYHIELITMHLTERVENLETGRVDVLFGALSWTMDRDVYLPEFQGGLGFAAVYSTMSSGFAGIKRYVACAEDGMRYLDECADMNICVLDGTRMYDLLVQQVPRSQLHLVQTLSDFFPALKEKTCNVIASTIANLNLLERMEAQQMDGEEFWSGESYFQTEPLSIVTRKEDHQWTKFCKYVMLGLSAAEYHGITKDNVLSIQESHQAVVRFQGPTGFGEEYQNMFIDAVTAVGNRGEMFDRTINPMILEREPINYVNNGTTGIIHSLPFGQLMTEGISLDIKFEELFNRGKLRCAVRSLENRPGFAEKIGNISETASFSGMDVDYCLAITASIFTTTVDTVEFVEVDNDADGLDFLARGEVDILAGVMADLERDVKDPGTGVGYSFSTPYFYNSSADGIQRDVDANLCLATRDDYSGWSEYVFWIVQATFYAEEEGITRFTANQMPTVELYGQRFTRIFRDAISAVGSYGEIYERNVEEHLPRQGLNLLHNKSNPSPLFYIPPGILAV